MWYTALPGSDSRLGCQSCQAACECASDRLGCILYTLAFYRHPFQDCSRDVPQLCLLLASVLVFPRALCASQPKAESIVQLPTSTEPGQCHAHGNLERQVLHSVRAPNGQDRQLQKEHARARFGRSGQGEMFFVGMMGSPTSAGFQKAKRWPA